MLIAERQREIAALVERERSARVTTLARLFKVTEETIRRDLEKLEMDGKLMRSHGGAVSRSTVFDLPFGEGEISFAAEKAAIAREAVKLIEEGDTILIDASTTALQMARMVPDMPLTVLTNSMQVCVELTSRPRMRVVCTGGTLSPPSLSFVGFRAEQMLSEYHVNRLFFSCTGVDFEHGLSDINESQAVLKQKMTAVAEHAYLMVDRHKFGVKSLKRFGQVSDVKTIITNDTVSPAIVEHLQALGVTVVLAAVR
jgi:DeoR/GlpR family transcriptional regulator of sugar metabolism